MGVSYRMSVCQMSCVSSDGACSWVGRARAPKKFRRFRRQKDKCGWRPDRPISRTHYTSSKHVCLAVAKSRLFTCWCFARAFADGLSSESVHKARRVCAPSRGYIRTTIICSGSYVTEAVGVGQEHNKVCHRLSSPPQARGDQTRPTRARTALGEVFPSPALWASTTSRL